MADCGEDVASLKVEAHPASTKVFIDGTEYGNIAETDIPLVTDITKVNILIRSESGSSSKDYILTIVRALPGNQLYHQRWNDVLAIIHNPENNGGRTIDSVRWFRSDKFMHNNRYVKLEGQVLEYHAEVKINGVWHKVCHVEGTRISRLYAWPNPVSRGENLVIELPETFIGSTLSIYTAGGSLVKTGIILPEAKTPVSVLDLANGVYLFRIVSVYGYSETVKIIVSD